MDRKIISLDVNDEKIRLGLEDKTVLTFSNTDENLENVDAMLRLQAEKRMSEIASELRKTKTYTNADAYFCVAGSISGFVTLYSVLFAAMHLFVEPDNPILPSSLKFAGGSTLTTAAIASLIIVRKHQQKKKRQKLIMEREKLVFLEENRKSFKNYSDYSNALNGLSKKKQKQIEESALPFTILDIDQFQKEDYEKIVDNIRYEKAIRGKTFHK